MKRRLAQREEMTALARETAERLRTSLAARAAVVFGSFARGDFHDGSDVDLLVISDEIPPRPADRMRTLAREGALGVDLFAYTEEEFREMIRRNHPTAYWSMREGIVLFDDGVWESLRAAAP